MKQIGLILVLLVSSTVFAADVTYRVTFEATWSSTTHPNSFPPNPHFSPPVGAAHNDDAVFWSVGSLASDGIESMAETGATGTMVSEIGDAIALGQVFGAAVIAGGVGSPGIVARDFDITLEYSRFTFVTMIAPSPDWFVGTSGLELRVNGLWRDNLVIDLYVHDAGTDSGPSYVSTNFNTNPAIPISVIDTPPLATGGYAPPVGTYTFAVQAVEGRPPYDDDDMDGWTNLREAGVGTDPFLEDTDVDTIFDPVDNCPTLANGSQLDFDSDKIGDLCDNCPSTANASQSDGNDDGLGDHCDLGDGRVLFTSVTRTSQSWQNDSAFSDYNVYRGNLQVLRGGGEYTQDPAAGDVETFCGVGTASLNDGYLPAPGSGVFYLVTGIVGTTEQSLGENSDGVSRPNSRPCP
ncbi:MAG: spondin domain-containing protein [Acidobacteriota bacterium]|nr:spondin domain-containing protein [Acidobacteriota bacterium]